MNTIETGAQAARNPSTQPTTDPDPKELAKQIEACFSEIVSQIESVLTEHERSQDAQISFPLVLHRLSGIACKGHALSTDLRSCSQLNRVAPREITEDEMEKLLAEFVRQINREGA